MIQKSEEIQTSTGFFELEKAFGKILNANSSHPNARVMDCARRFLATLAVEIVDDGQSEVKKDKRISNLARKYQRAVVRDLQIELGRKPTSEDIIKTLNVWIAVSAEQERLIQESFATLKV